MGLITDIEHFSGRSFVKLIDFLLLVSPGSLIIFHFDRTLIINLDVLKIMLLSCAISLPLFLIMFFAVGIMDSLLGVSDEKKNKDFDELFVFILIAALLVDVVLYSWLVAAYLSKITALHYMLAITITTFILAGILVLIALLTKPRDRGKA